MTPLDKQTEKFFDGVFMFFVACCFLFTGCKTVKNKAFEKSVTDSTGVSSSVTTRETVITEKAQDSIKVPGTSISATIDWLPSDTTTYVFESEDGFITVKSDPGTKRQHIKAGSKPRVLPVVVDKKTVTREASASDTKATVTRETVLKSKDKEVKGQSGTYITIIGALLICGFIIYLVRKFV